MCLHDGFSLRNNARPVKYFTKFPPGLSSGDLDIFHQLYSPVLGNLTFSFCLHHYGVGACHQRLQVGLIGFFLGLFLLGVGHQARTGGDQLTNDDILLQALQRVYLALDGRLGQYTSGLLEGCCGHKAVGGKGGLRDTLQNGCIGRFLAAAAVLGVMQGGVCRELNESLTKDCELTTLTYRDEEGRRIYDNIRKAIQFLLGSNMSEVLCIFAATLMGFTVLEPVHLLWINLVTDCFPALGLGMEKAEPNIMRRKPRDAKAGIFADGMGFDIAYQGVLVTVLVLVSYFIGHFVETGTRAITDSAHGTTMAFLTISFAEIFHSFNMRSQRRSVFSLPSQNVMLWVAAVVSLAATTAVCEIPFLADAFGFTAVGIKEYLIAAALGFCVIPIVELVKLIQRKAGKKQA